MKIRRYYIWKKKKVQTLSKSAARKGGGKKKTRKRNGKKDASSSNTDSAGVNKERNLEKENATLCPRQVEKGGKAPRTAEREGGRARATSSGRRSRSRPDRKKHQEEDLAAENGRGREKEGRIDLSVLARRKVSTNDDVAKVVRAEKKKRQVYSYWSGKRESLEEKNRDRSLQQFSTAVIEP